MTRRRHGDGNYGLSWGLPGFRIGRSQYGNWWISLGLPFGLRITKRLGRKALGSRSDYRGSEFPDVDEVKKISEKSAERDMQSNTENEKILDRIKNLNK